MNIFDTAPARGFLVVEGAYNATMSAHLVAGLKHYNQTPFSVMERCGRAAEQLHYEPAGGGGRHPATVCQYALRV